MAGWSVLHDVVPGWFKSEPVAQQRALQCGQCWELYVRVGEVLVCSEGHLRVGELIYDSEGQRMPYKSLLWAGECYYFHQGAHVSVCAECGSSAIYLQNRPVFRRVAKHYVHRLTKWCMITFFRRGVEQSGSSSGS